MTTFQLNDLKNTLLILDKVYMVSYFDISFGVPYLVVNDVELPYGDTVTRDTDLDMLRKRMVSIH